MIRTFKSKPLEAFFTTGKARGLPVRNAKRISRILRALDVAEEPTDMNIPGYSFHALKGSPGGQYAVTVSGNWRMTFRFCSGEATDVNIEDYH